MSKSKPKLEGVVANVVGPTVVTLGALILLAVFTVAYVYSSFRAYGCPWEGMILLEFGA